MNVQGMKSGYVFSRNPIILRNSYPSSAFDSRGGTFSLMLDGTNIYEGRFFPPMEIDLSEILDSHVAFFPEGVESVDNDRHGNFICGIIERNSFVYC